MKRFLCILLALCMLVCLCACGEAEEKPAVETEQTTTTATDAATTTTFLSNCPTATEGTSATTTADTTTTKLTTTTTTKTTTTTTKTTTTADDREDWEDTTAAPTTPPVKKSIRILAVGNSFSVDAMEIHLYWMLEAAGYNDIVLGNLYIGGCDLKTHYNHIKNDTAAYEFRVTTDGYWEYRKDVTAATAFNYADWDVVTLQQASPDSGRPDTYSSLPELAQMVRQQAKPKKLLWHMTWAYQQNSDHWAFGPYYQKNQMTMYNAIADAVTDQVLTNDLIDGVIPCGTAVQNMRTSALGDTLTADGYHLEDRKGDYLASLTWYYVITGNDPAKVGHCPGYIDDYFADMVKSVKNAVTTPTAVTPCQ